MRECSRRFRLLLILCTGAMLVVSYSPGYAGTEENKTMFKTFVDEVMNKGNMAIIDELLSEDFVEHEPLPGDVPEGREGCKMFFSMFRGAFPDVNVTIDDMIAEGDKVMARETWTGTNKGEFLGMPATGNKVEFQVIDIVRIVDGKAVEHWGVSDVATMMRQMHPEEEPGH